MPKSALNIESIKNAVLPVLVHYQIRRAGLFGSVVKGNATASSDIDMLVELGHEISLLEFVRIKYALEDLLNYNVDLVEYRALKPQLKERILAEEIKIYG